MFAKHIGGAAGFGDAQADASHGQASFRNFDFAIDAFFYAILHGGFGFTLGGLCLPELS